MGLGLGLCCCGGCYSTLYPTVGYLTAQYTVTISGLTGTPGTSCVVNNGTHVLTYAVGTPPGLVAYSKPIPLSSWSVLLFFRPTCTGPAVDCVEVQLAHSGGGRISLLCQNDGSLSFADFRNCTLIHALCDQCDPTDLDDIEVTVVRTA